MRLQLMIIRHAKAESPNASTRDFDRMLSRTGRQQAEGLNRWLRHRLQAEHPADWAALYSPALRTKQTAETVLSGLEGIHREADERIWNASLLDLVAVLRDDASGRPGLILIGHNPGLEQLLMHSTGQLRSVPTGSVTEMAFDSASTNGRLVTQFRPEIDSM